MNRGACIALLFGLSLSGHVFAQQSGTSAARVNIDTGAQRPTFYVFSHNHWEGAVFKTREEYLEIGFPQIIEALNQLEKYPEFRYILDQVAFVKPFLERYPEEAVAFRRFVKEGRLEIVGANIVMPDVNMPSGESWVRHALYGKRYYRQALGVDVKVGWALDTFGHHLQMPQLLKSAGYNSYWFQRGPRNDTPANFLWEGIDGTKIPAFWAAQTYGNLAVTPTNLPEFERLIRSRFHDLDPYTDWNQRVAWAGQDVSAPERHLPSMIRKYNEQPNRSMNIRFSLPSEFEKEAEKHERPVYKRELNPIFQGIYSSRIEVKQWMRMCEDILTATEKFSVLARWLGGTIDEPAVDSAWDPVLFNQAHDLASGVMVDKVYDDTMRGYKYAKQVGVELVDSYLNTITSKVDTRGDGIPVAIFNTLGWTRNDFVEVATGFSEDKTYDITVLDAAGKPVPAQLYETTRYDNGSIRDTKIGFIARDIPPMGYAVYRIARHELDPNDPSLPLVPSRWTGGTSHRDVESIENDKYKLTFELWTGAIRELIYRPTNWNVLGGRPANVVAREYDGGDFWELGGTLNGGRLVPMERQQLLPKNAALSTDTVGGSGRVSSGPVFSEFTIQHPFGSGHFFTRVRIYNGIDRIDFQTSILNNEKFVRYRVLFPTSIQNGVVTGEIPFGAIERPTDLELPAQNWTDYGDKQRGVALLNRAMPGNTVSSDTLMLSLMRSSQIIQYAFHGGFEPGVGSDTGLELGKLLKFDYSLLPHEGDWKKAGVHRAGWEFNHPLMARKAAVHEGTLPKSWGAFAISNPNVVVSAMKPGPDGSTILRLYEASGETANGVRMDWKVPLRSAHEANLVEDAMSELPVQNNSIQFDLGPYKIKTFRVQFASR